MEVKISKDIQRELARREGKMTCVEKIEVKITCAGYVGPMTLTYETHEHVFTFEDFDRVMGLMVRQAKGALETRPAPVPGSGEEVTEK